VNFYLPQQNLALLSTGLVANIRTDAIPGQSFMGTITAISPEVDPSTRNVKVQATLSNANKTLLPGMFANVKVVLPTVEPVLAVPVTSVAYATFGDSVFVVIEKTDEKTGKTQLIAQQQFIQLGASRGDYVSITKGINKGDTVVSAGVFKLFNGSPVEINNTVQAQYKLNPTPEDS
jgi:membrane fusion protein (multidrug efflux system)